MTSLLICTTTCIVMCECNNSMRRFPNVCQGASRLQGSFGGLATDAVVAAPMRKLCVFVFWIEAWCQQEEAKVFLKDRVSAIGAAWQCEEELKNFRNCAEKYVCGSDKTLGTFHTCSVFDFLTDRISRAEETKKIQGTGCPQKTFERESGVWVVC